MTTTYDVIKRPLVTEKSSALKAEANKVVFEVARNANKIDIKNAVKALFGVTVADVHTMVFRGKNKRVGKSQGRQQNWKKAIVTLNEGADLDVFGTAFDVPAAPEAEQG
jgi:large subunit ribosomal protein L23